MSNKWILLKGCVLIATALLISCSSVPQTETPAEQALVTASATGAEPASAMPDSVTAALFKGANSRPQIEEEERFDISVNQVPARDFFIGLVADSGVNVVTHPEVNGVISLDLKNVTLRNVLDVTRDVYGYEYKYNGGIYSIYPSKMRTELFEINYIDVQREGSTDTSVLIGEITSSGGNGSNQGGNSSNRNQSQGKQSNQDSSSGSRVSTKNKTDFWQDLKLTLSAIVGGEADGRNVVVNPQAGLVVVRALPGEISAVREFLDRSELSVRRQVILETKIVEVKLNDGFQAGVNWNEIRGQMLLTKNVETFDVPVDIVSASENVGEIFSSIFRIGDISQLLSLLETQGNVQVLSSPRVSTVNNQKAVIRVGSDEFFVTGISSQTTSTAASTTSAPNIELTSFFSGISLDVTPQIADNGDVILHVHPIVSEVTDQNKDITLGNEKFSLPLALREVRESDSIVRAQSGQIIVLGGLMKEKLNDVYSKRPGLGDVPVLNTLFRKRSKVSEKTELVILLRPIVVEDNTFADDINQSRQRVNSMSDEYRGR